MHLEPRKGAGPQPCTAKSPLRTACHSPVATRSLLRRAATAEIQYGCSRPWTSCMPCACLASASGFFFVSPHRATELSGRGGVRGPCRQCLPSLGLSPALTRHRRPTPCAPR